MVFSMGFSHENCSNWAVCITLDNLALKKQRNPALRKDAVNPVQAWRNSLYVSVSVSLPSCHDSKSVVLILTVIRIF